MELSFDHLVHIVNRPEETIEDLSTIGLKANLGGRHEFWGTYNALSYFGLSYIEFLGIFDYTIASSIKENDLIIQANQWLPEKEGFARIALRTNDIDEVIKRLDQLKIKTIGPIKGKRKREDGKLLQWEMLFISDHVENLPTPFIIQWHEADEVRLKDIEQINNPLKLQELVFAVENGELIAEKWSQWFQLKKKAPYKDKKLKANCISLELEGCNLVFASPYGQGEISRILEHNGEGPCLLKIANNNIVLEREMFGGYYQFV
ncbi:VOC family protein [Heyndrickxia oleronia]|uniref:VOC family protein n=1 Tax=Heyndrickxia oleronia TaxID=38875 RepID=UPI00203F8D25|nr:VOC family protein [Heyndrickxia oleronia]MCM3455153.1 VOC family protein [Heyndrickxia oleronia]